MKKSGVSTDSLTEFLSKSLEKLAAKYPKVAPSSWAEDGFKLPVALRDLDGFTDGFWEIADKDPRFDLLSGRWMSFAGSGHALDRHALPNTVLASVLTGQRVEHAILQFTEFGQTVSSAADYYVVITGVSVAHQVNVSDGVAIIPWDDVPDCQQKGYFNRNDHAGNFPNGLRPKPNCAITFRMADQRIIYPSAIRGIDAGSSMAELTRIVERARDLTRCMTILAGKPVAILGSWPLAQNEVAKLLVGVSFSGAPNAHEIALFGASLMPVALHGPDIVDIFRSLESFQSQHVIALQTAIDRLNLSHMQLMPVNKAIDLGIALEVMLLHDDSERGELKYRAALRGTQFIGGDVHSRLGNFDLLKKVYDLRSRAVHSGRLVTRQNDTDILERGTELCGIIARKLINLGRFPKWEADYVLNG